MALMGLSRAARGLLLLPLVAHSSWVPRPFAHYEAGAPANGSPSGVRRFRHYEAHQLEDGSDLELHWEVDTDPATILSLDLEHPGVRVEECHQGRLILHVDRGIATHLADWRYITGSESLHGCSHLKGEHLYHRIEKMEGLKNHSRLRDVVVAHFSTKELVSPAHMFSYCRYSFNLVPVQAKSSAAGGPVSGAPAAAAADERSAGESADSAAAPVASASAALAPARASASASASASAPGGRKLSTEFGSGDPQISNSFKPSGNGHKSLLNFDAPTQLGNIGYNWDYDANSTTNPQFKYNFPGGVGYAKLFKPYLRAHFSLNINFTSHIRSVEEPPHEVVTAELNGHGDFNLDLATAVNFKEERSAGVLKDVLKIIKLPGLQSQQGGGSEAFLNPITFYFGGTPLTIKPGFSCQLKGYHIGLLKGTLRVGMSSNIVMRGLMTFDTDVGLTTNISGRADNIKFTAPTWMLITQHFELGMMLEPMFWIKGGFGDMKNMEMGFSVRPYFNISILQENPAQLGGDTSTVAGLAVYPFRAVGLPAGRNFAIRIGANGENKTTAVKFSTGVVEFNDNVEAFDFGTITENALLGVKIEVALLENGREPPVATSSAICSSVVNGICKPSPVTAEMQLEGKSVYVHLTVVWNENALSILMSKMKSVALRFPSVSLQEELSQQLWGGQQQEQQQQSLELRVTRNGRSYSVPLSRKANSSRMLRSRVIYDLGPCFLDSWKSTSLTADRAAQDLLTPKLDLLIGGKVVGTGAMPPVSWDRQSSSNNIQHLAENIRTQLKTLPVMVPLYPPDGGSSIVGTGEIQIDVLPAQLAAFWVYPHQAESFLVGKHYTFYWTLVNGEPGKPVNFTLTAMEVGQDGRLTPTNWQRPVQVSCSIDTSVPVQRYDGGVTACLFAYDIQIPSSLADRQIVMVASWLGKSLLSPHWMVSTPVRFSTSQGRRLDGRWGSQSLGATNKTTFGTKVKTKLNKLASHCSAQPLKYRVNAGMNFVEHMKNVIIPVGGGLGSLGERPDWTSKPIPVMKQFGSGNGGGHLKDILPPILCSGGICEGMMPGCNRTKPNPLEISEINVKLSRVFRWKKHFGPKMRHMIAYGLALAPSAIQIGQKQATAAANSPAGRRLGARVEDSAEGEEAAEEEEVGHFVVEEDDGMDPDFGDEAVESFRVTIAEPIHYELTEELLQTFLRRGAFAGLSDGREATHGPVQVLRMELVKKQKQQPPPSQKKLLRLPRREEMQQGGGTASASSPAATATAAAPHLAASSAPEQMYEETGVRNMLGRLGGGHLHQAAITSLACGMLLSAALVVVRSTVRQRGYTLVRHSDGFNDARARASA